MISEMYGISQHGHPKTGNVEQPASPEPSPTSPLEIQEIQSSLEAHPKPKSSKNKKKSTNKAAKEDRRPNIEQYYDYIQEERADMKLKEKVFTIPLPMSRPSQSSVMSMDL